LGTEYNQINNELKNNNEHLSRKDLKMQELAKENESLRKEIEKLQQAKSNEPANNSQESPLATQHA
jgi:hypothetical protein